MIESSPFGPEPPFRCEVHRDGAGVVAFAPVGELDLVTVDAVADALRHAREQPHAALVLDLRGLTFMDSAGLHLVLDTDAWARRAGVQLTVVAGSPAVRRIFEITGVDRTLRLVDRPHGNGRNGQGAI